MNIFLLIAHVIFFFLFLASPEVLMDMVGHMTPDTGLVLQMPFCCDRKGFAAIYEKVFSFAFFSALNDKRMGFFILEKCQLWNKFVYFIDILSSDIGSGHSELICKAVSIQLESFESLFLYLPK